MVPKNNSKSRSNGRVERSTPAIKECARNSPQSERENRGERSPPRNRKEARSIVTGDIWVVRSKLRSVEKVSSALREKGRGSSELVHKGLGWARTTFSEMVTMALFGGGGDGENMRVGSRGNTRRSPLY